MALLEVKNIRKKFGAVEVLKGVGFSLERGEVVSIIGSSGNGKTTLLRCLNLLDLPEEGSICVGGETIFEAGKKYKERDLRKNRLHFGLVFQNFNLFPQYTALKNVQLALDLQTKMRYLEDVRVAKAQGREALKRIKKSKGELKALYADNAASAEQLLVSVGLGDKLKNYPCELSGGQCQRVAIARALALKPEILCFDEPTSALDPELTGEVLRVIRALKSKDRAMVIVTHEMRFAEQISDKVIFMADGVIEEIGTPQEVFGNPKSDKTRNFLQSRTSDVEDNL